MNLNEDKEQNQNVEPKYLDPESGFEIELQQDRLYKLRKTTKIVKPVRSDPSERQSTFSKLDHFDIRPDNINDEFEEDAFLTDDFLDEILTEARKEFFEEEINE